MQQGMMISGGSIKSEPFTSPDRRFQQYLSSGSIDLFGFYSPKNPTVTSPASLTPSSISFDDESEDHHDTAAITDTQLYLTRLTLQYRQLADRYDLCLSHLQDAADELEALRQENAELRIAKNDLAKRLSEIRNGRAIVDEFRRLRLAEEGTSPTSVLGGSFSHSEKRVTLPKSISIRSSGFLKLNPTGRPSGPSSSARFSQQQQQQQHQHQQQHQQQQQQHQHQHQHQKVYLGTGDQEKKSEVEVEVYNQGMFKTELCNKWEELGECPYGEHCQFAHGIGELRPVIRHPRYKTEVCRMVLSGDTCPYGHRCHFRHAISPTDRLN